MKRFLIQYTFKLEPEAEQAWHARVNEFIAELDRDPVLSGKVKYRCLKGNGTAYYHLAEVADEAANAVLRDRPFFQKYTEETKRVAGGAVEVTRLETIAETRAS